MNRSKYIIVSVVALAIAVLVFTRKPEARKEMYLQITNVLPDITLQEIYPANETSSILEYQLLPGDSYRVPLPAKYSEFQAIDTDGGVYNFVVDATNSSESIYLDISMENRTVFENTIESGGEFWTGNGSSTLRVVNTLPERDIYWLRMAGRLEDVENSEDILGAFILFPGRALNIRVAPGTYFLTAEDDERAKYSHETVELETGDNRGWDITGECYVTPPEESGTGTSRVVLCNALDDWIITGVYHRISSEEPWSENHISTGGIEPKQQYSLLLDPGKYDIRVVDEDNDNYTRLSVIISEEPLHWDITMDDLDRFIP